MYEGFIQSTIYINYQGAKVRKKIDIHKKNNDLPKENGKSLFSTCNSNYS